MRIILDIMSGDKAPLEMLTGAVNARAQEYSKGVDYVLVGDGNVIKRLAEENKLDICLFRVEVGEHKCLVTLELGVVTVRGKVSVAEYPIFLSVCHFRLSLFEDLGDRLVIVCGHTLSAVLGYEVAVLNSE